MRRKNSIHIHFVFLTQEHPKDLYIKQNLIHSNWTIIKMQQLPSKYIEIKNNSSWDIPRIHNLVAIL